MGFQIVYKALEEIFPEIDFRVLKAVAIENQNDVDAAVEVVLTKVMPCINARSRSSSSPRPSRTNVQSPNGSSMDASETRGQQEVALKYTTCLDVEQHGQFYDAECDRDQLLDDVNDSIHQLSKDSQVDSSKKDQNGVRVSFDLNVAHPSETDSNNVSWEQILNLHSSLGAAVSQKQGRDQTVLDASERHARMLVEYMHRGYQEMTAQNERSRLDQASLSHKLDAMMLHMGMNAAYFAAPPSIPYRLPGALAPDAFFASYEVAGDNGDGDGDE